MLEEDILDTRPTVHQPARNSTNISSALVGRRHTSAYGNGTGQWTTEYSRQFGWKFPRPRWMTAPPLERSRQEVPMLADQPASTLPAPSPPPMAIRRSETTTVQSPPPTQQLRTRAKRVIRQRDEECQTLEGGWAFRRLPLFIERAVQTTQRAHQTRPADPRPGKGKADVEITKLGAVPKSLTHAVQLAESVEETERWRCVQAMPAAGLPSCERPSQHSEHTGRSNLESEATVWPSTYTSQQAEEALPMTEYERAFGHPAWQRESVAGQPSTCHTTAAPYIQPTWVAQRPPRLARPIHHRSPSEGNNHGQSRSISSDEDNNDRREDEDDASHDTSVAQVRYVWARQRLGDHGS